MAGSVAIFRLDTAGQNESTAPEVIEFEGGAVPDATGKVVQTSLRMNRNVSPLPNPGRPLTSWTDNKLGVTEVIIAGHFNDKTNTTGPKQLFDWQNEDATNASLPEGRFGIRVDDFAAGMIDLVPIATDGYLLHDYFVAAEESPRGSLGFIAKFYRSGAIST